MKLVFSAITIGILSIGISPAYADNKATNPLERGKYIVQIGGCNDCHTPGYAQVGGKIPVENWLVGNAVGFAGPWGVTYPKNLRILFSEISEQQWLDMARTKEMLPPMPWFNLRETSVEDLNAMYQFIRSLGKAGEPAPAYAPPGIAVNTPYIDFIPKNLPVQAASTK